MFTARLSLDYFEKYSEQKILTKWNWQPTVPAPQYSYVLSFSIQINNNPTTGYLAEKYKNPDLDTLTACFRPDAPYFIGLNGDPNMQSINQIGYLEKYIW